MLICSRNELTEISINEKSLTNLTRFDCSYNQIKKIRFLGEANNLEKFIANDNFSVDIEFLNKLNPEKLLYLDMRNNLYSGSYYDNSYNSYNYNYGSRNHHVQPQPFPLSSFSKFTKLEVLMLGNEKDSVKRCNGSLANIRELTNLRKFFIRNSDITGDLEYLPKDLKLERFDYSGCPKDEQTKNLNWTIDPSRSLWKWNLEKS